MTAQMIRHSGENKQTAAASKSDAAMPEIEAVMHPHIYRIALACWLCFLAVFWVTFWSSSNALFQVVIGTAYAVIFFGVPWQMSRIFTGERGDEKSIWQFLSEPFRTRTGTMQGYEVLLQVIMVPVLLTLGGSVIGIVIRAARASL